MPTKKKPITNTTKAVMVTTEHRGVFFGYADPAALHGDIINLSRARLCVYWSEDMRGFMGLASAGPSSKCRIGPPVSSIDLRKITSVVEVSPEAVAKWEAAPWKQ